MTGQKAPAWPMPGSAARRGELPVVWPVR